MALEHALLVSLTERAGSGYELARRFDKSIGYFWSATHQQIYRVLRRMEESGWLHSESVAQEGRPDKKVYAVSEAGRAELARWIAEPTEPERERNEFFVKVRAAAYGDLDALLTEVARRRDEHLRQLELYRLIEKRDFPAPDQLTGTGLHQYLVLRAGIRKELGSAEWCDEVLQALRPDTPPSRPTAPGAD
ncbi:PadR family transcriptional regulator [Nocardia cyriacigeorgica]|uniref:PadR family transcriptional regulator n=1 Tax=Nocardia cyriacigeorgica TaxID=135487 RepID=A0A5R8NGB8_9NOCA|nr:PadR family transcriptional regulator [Nocardia cyriacigeorgica]TLF73617.1 PadR family transcriptional regulator [Nocardia cyriacigeorgica]